MIADYMKKPLVGSKFKLFRDLIMNFSGKHLRIAQQECVGRNIYDSREKGVESTKQVKRIKQQNYASAPTTRKDPKQSKQSQVTTE